jgi:hypothetical protein
LRIDCLISKEKQQASEDGREKMSFHFEAPHQEE